MKYILLSFVVFFFSLSAANAAGGESEPLPHMDWSFSGPLGVYDKASLQRGLKVYRNVCASCHGLKRVRYRELSALGYSEDQIKFIASEYTVEDGPNDEGEMFEREAKPSDAFVDPYENENVAKYANNGAFPPDLSLITKARSGGADYIYALMTGYEDAPADQELMAGQYWNKHMAGNVTAMPAPLSDELVSYEDGMPETLDQYSKDIAHFLTWAAEPEMEQRKRMGIKVVIYLMIFTFIMYLVKRKIWVNVKKKA